MASFNSSGYVKGPKKKTSQGKSHRRVKLSSMNKSKKRSFKMYQGQGR